MGESCVFCAIVAEQAPAEIVASGPDWLAFVPLGPHAPGHTLFVPKRHTDSAAADPGAAGMVMAAASAWLARQGRQGNLLTSVGQDATQTVNHLHIHVIPRGGGDGLGADWPWMRGDA